MNCNVEGCERPHLARGWCHLHYYRWYKNADTAKPLRLSPEPQWVCKCLNPVVTEIGECLTCHRKPLALILESVQRRAERLGL